ncbi:secretion protein [Flavobacterium davisii]|uniref:Secretion protein n=1 Tax=Flavobacterium davisii TaxID=2906077 RepID=A0A246GIU9_9FLAO|nr:GEVED domain-containing protein [Flavobacterium davisii]OWP84032.1 secretion protein [Flavobacterium davisii]
MKNKLLLIALLATGVVLGQNDLWKRTGTSRKALLNSKIQLPEKNLFDLNIDLIKEQLAKSTNRFSRSSSTLVISLPNSEGNLEKFRVYENSNMDPVLQAKYPQIRSYIGIGIDNPTSTAYFSMSLLGFKSMTLNAGKSASFIEPYSKDLKTYSVYKKTDKKEDLSPFECKVIDKVVPSFRTSGTNLRPNADDAILRTFRLALSVTGEYTAYFGGTRAQALAAMNATMTRVNGVFEKDFNVRMNLIANNDVLIYTNASTDPYSVASTGSGGAWNTELQNNLTNTIGNGAYDIGHLFGASGGGGNAGCIGCICVDDTVSTTDKNKGSGYTSPSDGVPQGNNFDIDYVAHEMGHQFGANHTFSHGNEGTGANMEPGSGSTIMGYAGITAQDVQPHSDAYFHAFSIQQVTNNIKNKNCSVNTATGNAVPTANAGLDFTIPKSTPFILTGAGTDANADALTYAWEQFDNATSSQTGTSSAAIATKTAGPTFRSYNPTTSPSRYFPQMTSVLAGGTTTQGTDIVVEALPSVARTMNFRFTVRDNRAGGSVNNSDDMIVTVNGTAGPFSITSQGSATSYTGGTSQMVTWNVAGTTANGVNCANVDILWSTNNGATWIPLLTGTLNDGTENITIPNTVTTTGRIMVKGSNHIFFDVNNANITVVAGSSDTIAPTAPTALTASGTTEISTSLSWIASTDNVGVTGYDVYQDTVLIGSTATTTYNVTGLTASTSYTFTIKAKDAAGNISNASNAITVTTSAPVIDTTAPTAPTLSASGTTTTTTNLSWSGATDNVGVTAYNVYQGTTLLGTTSSTSYNVVGLTAATTYSFTVKAKDAAGNISNASNIVSVTTSSNSLTYCTSKGNSTADEKIAKVVIGSINNSSTGTVGYENFTTLSTSAIRGNAQTITITPSWASTTYPEGYAVFIDYNQDGDFADAGETVWTKAASTTTSVSGTFTVPTTATLGTTRMRVSMKYNGIPTACEAFSYGQVEDYTINISSSAKEVEKNSISKLDITVFPIPTSDILSVKGTSESATYKVYNLVGQIILEGKINVTNCSAGNYVLEVSDPNTTVTKRFIKE